MKTRPVAEPEVWVGPYRVLHRLGEGGMGVVHLAEAPDGSRVAVKVLRPHVVGDDEARQRLAREVNSLGRVHSDLVAEIIDADPWGPIPFVATRYVPGLSLHDHVHEQGPISGDDLVHFACSLAEALLAVHRAGVLHRDIKPSNVLLEGRTAVLIDFGLARVAEDQRLTRTGWLLGTPGYLAPEILHGDEPTEASDVHSWAATVVYAGTGRSPFGRGPSLAVLDRARRGEHDLGGLDGRLRAVLEAALRPEPEHRPSLPDVLEALGAPVARERFDPWSAAPTVVVPEDPPSTRPFTVVGQVPVTEAGPPPRVGFLEGCRRWLLGLALLGAVAASVAAAPWVATASLLGAVTVLRWLSVAGFSASERRRVRGRRWYDGVLTMVSSPVDLVASVPGTLLLVVSAAGVVGVGALVCAASDTTVRQGLPALGALLALTLWLGPCARRVRSPLRRVGLPLARSPWTWVVTLVLLGAVTGWASWLFVQHGADWSPGDHAPWQGTALERHFSR